ncbi:MAG: hypothetical protein ACNYPD_05570 [Candidatus Halichondribacter symbioticus]
MPITNSQVFFANNPLYNLVIPDNKFIESLSSCNQRAFGMPSHREGYAQKTPLVGTRVSDDEDPKG